MKKVIVFIRCFYPRDYLLDLYDINYRKEAMGVLPALFHSYKKAESYARSFCKAHNFEIVEYARTPMKRR